MSPDPSLDQLLQAKRAELEGMDADDLFGHEKFGEMRQAEIEGQVMGLEEKLCDMEDRELFGASVLDAMMRAEVERQLEEYRQEMTRDADKPHVVPQQPAGP